MKTFLIVVTVLVLSITMHLQSDAAPTRSEEFGEQIWRIVNDGYPEAQSAQRVTENTNEENPKRICYDSACGWHTYNTTTRRSTFFMPSTCKCPDETYKCIRTGENVSMSAYVYHCRQNTTADDIESPDYIS